LLTSTRTSGSYQKVLILKLLGIGDIIMALPMLDAIRTRYPSANVTWICCRSAAPALEDNPLIHELILIDDAILFGTLWDRIQHSIKLWRRILGRRYDLVINAHRDRRYRLLTLPVRCDDRRSFSWPPVKRFRPSPGRWHGHEYVQLVTKVDDYSASPASVPRIAAPVPQQFQHLFGDQTKTVVLAPGAGSATPGGGVEGRLRHWPVGNYVELARRLSAEGVRVFLTGGTGDKELGAHFEELSVINLIGTTSLKESIGIYGACDVVVANDSGPMHLAYASGTAVVGLFGPTMPSEKFPPNIRGVALWVGTRLPCCPCHNGKYWTKCGNNVCMQMLTVEQVFQVVQQLLHEV
jgi:lipopolysaccharide heptosyltransferase II